MSKIDPKSASGMVPDIGAALAPSFSDSDPDAMKRVGDDLGSLIDLYRGHRDELMRAIADFKQNVDGQTLEGGADAFKGEMTQATSAHLSYANALKKFAAKTGANVDAASAGGDLARALRRESSDVRAFIAKRADGAAAEQLRSLPDRADRLAKDVEQRGDPDLVASEKEAYWAAAKHADAICASAAAN